MKTTDFTQDAMARFSASDCSLFGRTHLDLFSGIGGFALAAQAAGYSTIGFSEIEPYACKILKRHWPAVPNYGDIRNVRGVRADLITGGFPCQPFSLAGKRLGAADDRHLWPEMCRVIGEARPTWVLGENVPGIIGVELDRVLSDLEGLGYACWPLVVPACALDARHRRDRVWIVAHSDGRQHESGSAQSGKRDVAGCNGAEDGAVADAIEGGRGRWTPEPRRRPETRTAAQGACETLPDAGCRCGQRAGRCECGEPQPARWQPEPELGRVADGIPHRSHRLRGLGNAIVPQVAETLIRMMARTENVPDQAREE